MLTEKEKQFIKLWQNEREKKNTFARKLITGLPMAMLFSLPILILVFVVYIFFPEWYTKVSNISAGTFVTIVVAVFICIIFFSYFRMQYKWEMNEQLFRELKVKESKADAANKA